MTPSGRKFTNVNNIPVKLQSLSFSHGRFTFVVWPRERIIKTLGTFSGYFFSLKMASAIPKGEVEDLMTCPVCLCGFDVNLRKPKFLACSHTICLSCLEVSYVDSTLSLNHLQSGEYLHCEFYRVFTRMDRCPAPYARSCVPSKGKVLLAYQTTPTLCTWWSWRNPARSSRGKSSSSMSFVYSQPLLTCSCFILGHIALSETLKTYWKSRRILWVARLNWNKP